MGNFLSTASASLLRGQDERFILIHLPWIFKAYLELPIASGSIIKDAVCFFSLPPWNPARRLNTSIPVSPKLFRHNKHDAAVKLLITWFGRHICLNRATNVLHGSFQKVVGIICSLPTPAVERVTFSGFWNLFSVPLGTLLAMRKTSLV